MSSSAAPAAAESSNAKGKTKQKKRVGFDHDHVARRLLIAGGIPRISRKEGHIQVVNRYIRYSIRKLTARARRHAAAEDCGTLAYLHMRKALEELGCRRLHLCMTKRESQMVEKAAERRAKAAKRAEAKRAAAESVAPADA